MGGAVVGWRGGGLWPPFWVGRFVSIAVARVGLGGSELHDQCA